MKLLKWFYPGMRIKRWIALAVFGVIMLSMGFVIIISEQQGKATFGSSVIVLLGVVALITGVKRIINSLITIFLPSSEKDLVDIIYKKRQLERGPRIVAIGGGKGLTVVLRGLKEHTNNLSAILTMVDEGLITDTVHDHFGMPQTSSSDIRECLIALADAEPVVGRLFHYRFKKGTELWGHNFGDLYLSAMSEIAGDFDKAVKESSRVLAVKGQVMLSTLRKVALIARHQDGSETIGKENILSSASRIKEVYLRPQTAEATQEAVSAILKADAVIIGPGGLYTSIMPGLLIEGIRKALITSSAPKIYIMNIMTVPGETDEYKANDHLRAVASHVGPKLVDYCVVNKDPVPQARMKSYEQEGAFPVEIDKKAITETMCGLIEWPLLDKKSDFIHHDAAALAAVTMNLINESKKAKPHARRQ
jgi:uncharacterized cofD-like protein